MLLGTSSLVISIQMKMSYIIEMLYKQITLRNQHEPFDLIYPLRTSDIAKRRAFSYHEIWKNGEQETLQFKATTIIAGLMKGWRG